MTRRGVGVYFAILCWCVPSPIWAFEIWNGPRIVFSKPAGADPTLAIYQDHITSNVWLTRASSAGLFNARTESGYTFDQSPDDTEWAYGTTGDIASLTFQDWRTAVSNNPPAAVGEDMVLHLISDDIYIDIVLLSWGVSPASGGFFSYERSTPIPEPATVTMSLPMLLFYMSRRSSSDRARQSPFLQRR